MIVAAAIPAAARRSRSGDHTDAANVSSVRRYGGTRHASRMVRPASSAHATDKRDQLANSPTAAPGMSSRGPQPANGRGTTATRGGSNKSSATATSANVSAKYPPALKAV